jgi:hypothetical protein|nr:MAG TPA: hypothetical protein [Caudoviricetes sp.]
MSNEMQEHIKALLMWLISPEVLSQIGVYIGVGASIYGVGIKAFKKLWVNLEAKQNDEIDSIKNSINALTVSFQELHRNQERDFLRLQIITGIHSGRLSESEILYLYDQYKEKGYNSYVSRVVDDYVEELRASNKEKEK